MLYLFNSAFRNTYATNVLNTLYLPTGAINTYQYSKDRGDKTYVHSSAYAAKCFKHEEVIICFIDRAIPDDFKFYPIRKGTLISCEERDGRIYYAIKLGAYFSCIGVEQFNSKLKKALSGFLFNCSDDNTESGYFAFKHDYYATDEVESNEKSWSSIVDQIAKCKYMQQYYCLFTRFHLYKADGRTPVKIRSCGSKWYYPVRFKRNYVIRIDYCIPSADDNPQDMYVDTVIETTPESFQCPNSRLRYGARASSAEYQMTVAAISRSISFYQEAKCSLDDKSLLTADKPVCFISTRSAKRWFLIALCFLGLLICNVLIGLQTSDIIDAGNKLLSQGIDLSPYKGIIYSVSIWLNTISDIYPAITGLCSSALTLLLVLLYGKKEL